MARKQAKKTNKWIVVRNSGIHGKGVFAVKDIPKNTYVIEYTGEKITKKEGDRRSDLHDDDGWVWVFQLNDKWDVDGATNGSDARFINHSCHPNCEPIIVDDKEIWISSLRKIKKGEELSYDYGYDDDDTKCKCGSKKCRGIMSTTNGD